jgi:hypothetical protein
MSKNILPQVWSFFSTFFASVAISAPFAAGFGPCGSEWLLLAASQMEGGRDVG